MAVGSIVGTGAEVAVAVAVGCSGFTTSGRKLSIVGVTPPARRGGSLPIMLTSSMANKNEVKSMIETLLL